MKKKYKKHTKKRKPSNSWIMKKHCGLLLFIIFSIILSGCAAYVRMDSNKWKQYEMPPSKIDYSGNIFFEGTLSDGALFNVFADSKVDEDATFYYVNLMQDFGWRKSEEKTWTAPQGSRQYKLGYLYINPSKRVALYFHPSGKYSAFKINVFYIDTQ